MYKRSNRLIFCVIPIIYDITNMFTTGDGSLNRERTMAGCVKLPWLAFTKVAENRVRAL